MTAAVRSFDFEVAIVGGGPAGSSTALHLVRRENVQAERIVVIDKATFPRDKPCAGAVSQLGVEELAAIGIEVRVPSVEMRGARVISSDDVGETEYPMGIVVRRTEFDAQLLHDARGDGVCVREGEGLDSIERLDSATGGGYRITTPRGSFTARYVAASDGAGSRTRKALGLREPERKGHLYVLDTEANERDTGVGRGLVDFDLTVLDDGLEGYYWDFPTPIGGATQVSRGIYHANFTARSDVKAVLARHLAKRGIDIDKVKLRPFSTRPFVPGSTTWQRDLVFVGEAAGIDHTTGEGIAQAIAMGRMAAAHLARALRERRTTFHDYDREIRESIVGRHLLQSAFLAKVVYGRFGRPARKYLLRSTYAREQAMRWYRGDALPMWNQVKLGLGLFTAAL
jgi:menaquinone-9 beta-reductase